MPRGRWIVGALVLAVSAALVTTGAVRSGPGSPAPVAVPAPGAPAAGAPPGPSTGAGPLPVGWLRLSSPDADDVAAAAATARVVVLNPWETATLRALKAADPGVVVLCYKDLSSTRSYAVHDGVDDAVLPTGLGFAASQADEALFAHDAAGNRIEWQGYDRHWQMAVWSQTYRSAWVSAVAAEVASAGWDGIMADNALTGLGYYDPGVVLEGGRTDADVAEGTAELVEQARAALGAHGLRVVPNIPDGRFDPARFARLAGSDGALEEHLAHVADTVGASYLDADDPAGWGAQVRLLAALPDTAVRFAVTSVAAGDDQAARYGLGTFLLATGGVGPAAWTGVSHDAYVGFPFLPEQHVALGAPAGPLAQRGDGTWARPFASGVVVVNPTSHAVTTDVGGVPLRIDAHDAAIRGR